MAKDDLLQVLRKLLSKVVEARFEGGAYAKLSRAHGYADGYMAALLDTGTVDRDALLKVVREERFKLAAGPITAH